MKLEFRPLRADEVELRVNTCNEKGFSLLLYKDARCDQNILDETVGVMNWKKSYQLIDYQLFCTIEIWDEDKKQWIGKQDVGIESNTEAEKGRASDAQKRSAFAFGIGRELYTAPYIWISGNTAKNTKGKYVPVKSYDRKLKVSELKTENGVITALVIKDDTGKAVYSYGKTNVKVEKPKKETPKETSDDKERKMLLVEVKKLMASTGVPESDILEISKFDRLEDFDVPELQGCIKWLKQKGGQNAD